MKGGRWYRRSLSGYPAPHPPCSQGPPAVVWTAACLAGPMRSLTLEPLRDGRERRRVMVTGGGEGWRGRVRGGGEEGVGMEVRGRIENEGGRRTGEAGGVPDRAVPSPRGAQLEVAGLRTAAVASTGLSSRWACLRASHAWQTGVVGLFERSRSRTWLLSSRTRRSLLGLVRRSRAHGPRERGHNLGVARSEDGHPRAGLVGARRRASRMGTGGGAVRPRKRARVGAPPQSIVEDLQNLRFCSLF